MAAAVIAAGMLAANQAGAAPVEIVDDTDRVVRLERPAERIIALYGAYNEMLAAMGLESRLVGRTKADTFPPSILAKPSIGTHMRPNIEVIMGLRPDLIIQGAGRREAMAPVNQLRSEGLTVAVFNPASFKELFSVIERLGILAGEPSAAAELVGSMRNRLDKVEKRVASIAARPRLFFEVRYPDMLAAGTSSMVDEIIQVAGGSNCTRVAKKLVRTNLESVLACNPENYVVQRGPMNRNPTPPIERPHFGLLEAVKKGRVLIVDEHVFSRPGPRSVDAVEQLAAFIHPESGDNPPR